MKRGPNHNTKAAIARVRHCLDNNHEHNRPELLRCTGLTEARATRALNYLREDPELPFPYRCLLARYGYARTEAEFERYKRFILRRHITGLSRLRTSGFLPAARQWGTRPRAERHLEVTVEDLQDLLA